MKPRFLLFTLFVALFPVSLFSNTLYFPQVAFGGGYSTTFAIVNTGTTGVSGRLNLFSQSGTLRSDLGGQAMAVHPGKPHDVAACDRFQRDPVTEKTVVSLVLATRNVEKGRADPVTAKQCAKPRENRTMADELQLVRVREGLQRLCQLHDESIASAGRE